MKSARETRGDDQDEGDLRLAREAARQAAGRGARAIARIEERRRTHFHVDARHLAAQGSSTADRVRVVHVVSDGSVETRESALGARPLTRDSRRREPVLDPHQVWAAVLAGFERAARGRAVGVELSLSITSERSRLALARAGGREPGPDLVRASHDVALEGVLALARPGAQATTFRAGARLGSRESLAPFLEGARASGQVALAQALARGRAPAPLPRRAGLTLLSPGVLTWVLFGPVFEGLRAASPGERAEAPPWLRFEDGGALDEDPWPDEEGLVPAPEPLVAEGRWVRGPFRPFDGSGRTRREKTGELLADAASLVGRVVPDRPGFRASRRALEARADIALTEVASADPLPGGAVAVVAHALVRRKGRWAPAGLASVRLRAHALWSRCRGASAASDPAWAQRLPLLLPWLLVEGLVLRPGV